MDEEKAVVQLILERFPVLEGHVRAVGVRRVELDPLVRRDFEKVFSFLTEAGGFERLVMLAGTDDGDWLGFTYAITNADEVVLLLRQRVSKAWPEIRSVCSRFPSAWWQERELFDLFGVEVLDAPAGANYPLPEGWPAGSFPLRKEWDPSRLNKDKMTYAQEGGDE